METEVRQHLAKLREHWIRNGKSAKAVLYLFETEFTWIVKCRSEGVKWETIEQQLWKLL